MLAALFALAATSQSPPTQITDVAQDEVILSPGDPPVHRRLSVRIDAVASEYGGGDAAKLQFAIQARPRWPRVEPPARFILSRVGVSGAPEMGTGSSLTVDSEACGRDCTVDVDVAIDWPAAAGRPRSSIAWELATTISAANGYVYGSVNVTGEALHRTNGGTAWWLGLLGVVPFIAVSLRARVASSTSIGRRGARMAGDAAVIAAGSLLAIGLAFAPVVVPPSSLEPAADGVAKSLTVIGPILGISIGAGIVRWWWGAGALLAIIVFGSTLVGLLFGAMLVVAASETFAARGLQIATVATLLAAVVLVRSESRMGWHDGMGVSEPGSTPRIAVAGIQLALAIGLLPNLPPAALLLAIASAIWWVGRGHLLGLASVLIGGAFTGMLRLQGPSLFGGTRWTTIETTSLLLGGIATLIGLLAAFGAFARHPDRPAGKPASAAPPVPISAPD